MYRLLFLNLIYLAIAIFNKELTFAPKEIFTLQNDDKSHLKI